MKKLYIVLKFIQGSNDSRKLKVYKIVDGELVSVLDKYLMKDLDIEDYSQKSISDYINRQLLINEIFELIYL